MLSQFRAIIVHVCIVFVGVGSKIPKVIAVLHWNSKLGYRSSVYVLLILSLLLIIILYLYHGAMLRALSSRFNAILHVYKRLYVPHQWTWPYLLYYTIVCDVLHAIIAVIIASDRILGYLISVHAV